MPPPRGSAHGAVPREGAQGRRGQLLVLTELPVACGLPAEQGSAEQQLQVVEQDEGWGCWGPPVVLLNQVVPLELPDLVRVLLDLLEGVAGAEPRCQPCREDEGVHHACMASQLLPIPLISPSLYPLPPPRL